MIVTKFAEFAADHRATSLDDDVYRASTRAIVDWFGATIAGADMPPARALRAGLALDGEGTATVILGDRGMSPRNAALVNGTASHTVEMDDIYRDGIYHPGSPTVAAALAAAELAGVGGERLLRAVAVGYEIGARIAVAIQPAHYTYWHTTGTVGTIGAAAAAAEVLGLDTRQFAHALATATTCAAGLQQAFRSDAMSKPLHAGHAAEAGLLAALAAEHDFTGALDILEGEAGFGRAMSEQPRWQDAVAALGKPWAVTEVTVKNHACCGHTFAAIDAALELRAAGLRPDAVEYIEIGTYSTATRVAGNPDPRTEFEAKFSLSYCVAVALARGSVRLAAFDADALAAADIRELMARTKVVARHDYDASFPKQRRAHLLVKQRDGAVRTAERHTRKGDPDDPLTDQQLRDKFLELATPHLGSDPSMRLYEQLIKLHDSPSLRGVKELVRDSSEVLR